MGLLNVDDATDFLDNPRGDKQFRLNISRNTLLAFLVSILLHGLILFFVVPKLEGKPIPPATTITVELTPKAVLPIPLPPQEAQPVEQLPDPKPAPKVITQKPSSKPNKPKPRDFSVPDVLATQKPAPVTVPTKPETAIPDDAPTDMASYIAQQRAKRGAAENDAANQNAQAVAAEQPLTEEAKRDARIAANLKGNTNGIFEVKRIESRSASFSFKGWTDYSNVKLKFYEVEVEQGQDIHLAVVRRMIAIIREHYQADFPWESHRLGRVVTKSARLEDSAELESFLMQEFFENRAKTF